MLASIKNLVESLEIENIMYCHWKSNEHLNESMNGDTDLDMLFSPSQRDRIEKILAECGLKRFRATPLMQYNAVEDFIGFDKETAKIWHLHLHYRLTLGEKHLKGYTLPWTEYILNNRIYNPHYEIYCSQPEDEYFLILLRIALKLRWRDFGKNLGKDDIIEINWLKKRSNKAKVIKIAYDLLGPECEKEYERLVNKEIQTKNELFRLQGLLRSTMQYFTSYNIATSYFKRTVRECFWLMGGISKRLGLNSTVPHRRVSPSGGAVIAILGCDGAGKSTTISNLKKEFGKKLDIINVYLGSGDGSSSILRLPMRFIAKKVGGKGVGKKVEEEIAAAADEKSSISVKARLYSLAKIFWAVTLASEKKNKLKIITKARNHGVLVLVDRYPQVEIMGYNDGPLLYKYLKGKSWLLRKLANWEISVYKSFYLNLPDLAVKLLVPTEVAIQRKPEMTVYEIEKKKEAVKKMRLCSNSVEIDTARDKRISLGEVMEAIWKII